MKPPLVLTKIHGDISMKKTVIAMLVLVLLNLWVPFARAEISQDLDPMVSSEPQATVAEETSMSGKTTGRTSNVVSTANTMASEKKVEEPKKKKTKKSSTKKSSSKKSSKSNPKKSKTNKKSSN